ncbi:MAG: PAS domain-containing protein [Chitinispirillaceae bacterium]
MSFPKYYRMRLKLNFSFLIISAIITVLIFLGDLFLPLGYSVWPLYTIPLFLLSGVPQRRILVIACSIFTLLIFLGYNFSEEYSVPSLVSVVNRLGGIAALWIVVYILCSRISSYRQVYDYYALNEAILSSINEGLMVASAEGQVVRVNRFAVDLLGYHSEEEALRALSKLPSGWEMFDLNGRKLLLEEWPIYKAVRRQRFEAQVYKNMRIDTGRVWYGSYCGSPVLDIKGRHRLSVVTFRDVSSMLRSEDVLREAKELSEKKQAEKDI